LPGIEHTEIWTPEFVKYVKYDDRGWLKGQEQFWMLNNLEAARRMQTEKWFWLTREAKMFLPDLRSRHLTVRTLADIGLLAFIDLHKVWSKDSPELLELIERCKTKKVGIALGTKPTAQTNGVKFLSGLLKRVGVETKVREVQQHGGEKVRFYGIDTEAFTSATRQTVLGCLEKRWEKYLGDEWQAPNFFPNSDTGEVGENQTVGTILYTDNPQLSELKQLEQRELVKDDGEVLEAELIEYVREVELMATNSDTNGGQDLWRTIQCLGEVVQCGVWERLSERYQEVVSEWCKLAA
jgi:hypothetical protein